uniref:Uncharacterized protein n=1 Tax=viral metagenome TaxID=1070528 RepID=A0A6C0J6T4_9ZZZZ
MASNTIASNKIASNTNYFKQVSEFGKNVFSSELDETGVTYNIFDFVIKNIIVLIFIIIIIIIIYLGISYFRQESRVYENKLVTDSFYHSQLDDKDSKIITCNSMEIPSQSTKYSYTFNLIINEFYCNKGTWKCIMLKGIDMSDYKETPCENMSNNSDNLTINKNISAKDCFEYVCNKEKDALENNDNNVNELEILAPSYIVDTENINSRVDLICRATKMGKEGKDLLSCGMSKCGLIGNKNMLRGLADSFIDDHSEYCNKVYTTIEKVDKNTKERYDDEVDNICSTRNLMEKYPHLIPRDLSKYYNSKETLDRNNLEKYDNDNDDTCWNTLIGKLPIQAPGVWLHPFVNNIRIVLTTYSSKKYDEDDFNFSHSHDSAAYSDRKYKISKITQDGGGTKHASVTKYSPTCSGFSNENLEKNENVYREFFDIENFPIKENFHFALVINDNSCEVYMNGKLVKTQILFGQPRYNKGDLYLNHIGGASLNGSLKDFQFFAHAINQNNIINLLSDKPMIQDNENLNSGLHIDKEHQHELDVVHTHKYENSTEDHHNHTLEEDHVNKEYHLND